jgi:nucleotide-binding universal stress UspA family protein
VTAVTPSKTRACNNHRINPNPEDTMKTLLVALLPDEELDLSLDVATALARRHGSHIIGYMPIPGPILLPVATPMAMVPFDDTMRSRYREMLPTVQAAFEKRMSAEGLSSEFRSDEQSNLNLSPGIIAQSRTCDLVIVQMRQSDGKVTADSVDCVADIVMASGRPVMAIPAQLSRPFAYDRVTLAWNASRESARAAFDCAPLLSKAKEVELVWVNPQDTPIGDVDIAGAEIATVLARHDIKITDTPITSDQKAGPAIVKQATINASDLLVIGAYGHSRLRERILGGATEYILRNPPCTILLSN